MIDSPCERERKSLTALRRSVRGDNEDESDFHLVKQFSSLSLAVA